MVPPSGMASRALTAILTSASSSSPRSTSTGQILSSMSQMNSILPRSEGASMSRTASMRWRRSTTTGINCWRREKVEQLPGQLFAAIGGGADRLDRLHVLRLAQPALQDLRVAGNDHQQIVEVVGDAAGELAERLHLLRLGELLAGLLERDLRLVLGGDVAGELGEADQLAGIVADGVHHHAGIEAAAVLAHQPALRLELALARGRDERLLRHVAGANLLGKEDAEMLADDLVGAVAFDALRRRRSSCARGLRCRACRSRSRARP